MSLDEPVSELMQRDVVTLQKNERLDLADDIMRLGRIRHLPIVEGEKLVGILSNRDLLAASLSRALDFDPEERRAFMRSVEVKEVMTSEVDVASPDDRAFDAGRRMLRRMLGCLPVVDEAGKLVGLLTETDLLRAALGEEPDGDVVDVVPESGETGVFDQELDDLRRARDELRVQIHLGKAEASELWTKLEARFAEAESHARTLARQAEKPLDDVAAAGRLLIDEIRNGYRRLRELL